jgi:hypothetical protein
MDANKPRCLFCNDIFEYKQNRKKECCSTECRVKYKRFQRKKWILEERINPTHSETLDKIKIRSEKVRTSSKKYIEKNKEKVKTTQKKWYEKNKDKRKKSMLKYRNENKTKIKKIRKKWGEKNKKHVNDYFVKKRRIDPNFKLAGILRTRINQCIKKSYKSSKSQELLGCTIQEAREHLEKQFKEGMTWENHGKYGWHIDHIIPCASFDLTDPEQQKKCFHYTNLQPLWAKENISKGCKNPMAENIEKL